MGDEVYIHLFWEFEHLIDGPYLIPGRAWELLSLVCGGESNRTEGGGDGVDSALSSGNCIASAEGI